MKVTLQANEGERVSLNAPLCGDILVKTDPSAAGAVPAMALQTLPAGAVFPLHRYLNHPLLIWVSKGQGRITVGQRQFTVVPGHSAVVPAGEWYGLRNTGTGLFQVVWVAPASLITFFKSFAQATAPVDQAALQVLGQPYGIEFQLGEVKPAKSASRGSRFPRRGPKPKPQGPQERQPGSRARRPRPGHVKEVFMNGRWVRVSSEGPIVAS